MPRSNKFLTCQSDAMSFECWIFFSFHLTSSHRSFSCKLLIASHCHRSLCHPISRLVSFFHLILCLLSLSRLFSADHFSCRLSFSHLFSSHLSLPQLFPALRSSCQFILCLLISSLLFSHLLSSPNISSTDLRSCQLVPPHLSSSQRALKSSQLFSSPKPAPKTDLGARASDPYAFHRKDLTQRSVYTQQVFAPHRSFFTETGKLFHRDREAFARRKLLRRASFYTEKPSHREASTEKSFYTQKLLHTEAPTRRSFYTQQAFTHNKLLHREALTQLLRTASLHTEKPLHEKAFPQGSFYTQQAFTQTSFYTQKL